MFNFKTFAATFGVVTVLSAHATLAAGFAISLNYVNVFSASQTDVINAAAAYWESAIVDYKSGVSLNGITINVESVTSDGSGGGLAAAGVTGTALRKGTRYATTGVLLFDEADLGTLESRGKLIDVAVHEIAHALGFGTLWQTNGLYDPSTGVTGTATSGHYTGAAALAAYQSEYAPAATFVPVEKNFGPGSADAHWDETWAGGAAALMTGRLAIGSTAPPSYITRTTIASFDDLGYQVALNRATLTPNIPIGAVPLPPAAVLLFASVAMLGAVRWRKAA
ncbi:MAG: hypothetical protein ACJAVR_000166 [Paracoccaceae bacterium]|jgi:hypothetical protein